MVPDSYTSPTADRTETDDGFGTFVNALLGGIAGVVLSFVPLSPVLGGAIAGYLEGGTSNDGMKVGAIAGAIMLLPLVFFGLFFLVILGLGQAPIGFGVFALVLLLFGALYTVGLSALGGWLGIYVKYEL